MLPGSSKCSVYRSKYAHWKLFQTQKNCFIDLKLMIQCKSIFIIVKFLLFHAKTLKVFFSKRHFSNCRTRLQGNCSMDFNEILGICYPYNYFVNERRNLKSNQNYYFFPILRVNFRRRKKCLLSDGRHFVYEHGTLISFVQRQVFQSSFKRFFFFFFWISSSRVILSTSQPYCLKMLRETSYKSAVFYYFLTKNSQEIFI